MNINEQRIHVIYILEFPFTHTERAVLAPNLLLIFFTGNIISPQEQPISSPSAYSKHPSHPPTTSSLYVESVFSRMHRLLRRTLSTSWKVVESKHTLTNTSFFSRQVSRFLTTLCCYLCISCFCDIVLLPSRIRKVHNLRLSFHDTSQKFHDRLDNKGKMFGASEVHLFM